MVEPQPWQADDAGSIPPRSNGAFGFNGVILRPFGHNAHVAQW